MNVHSKPWLGWIGGVAVGGLGPEQVQVAMEHMAHDQGRVGVQGRLDGRDRVIAIALELVNRLLVEGNGIPARRGQAIAWRMASARSGVRKT